MVNVDGGNLQIHPMFRHSHLVAAILNIWKSQDHDWNLDRKSISLGRIACVAHTISPTLHNTIKHNSNYMFDQKNQRKTIKPHKTLSFLMVSRGFSCLLDIQIPSNQTSRPKSYRIPADSRRPGQPGHSKRSTRRFRNPPRRGTFALPADLRDVTVGKKGRFLYRKTGL